MGLDLSVGYLADLAENDEEGAAVARRDFEVLNEFLRHEGLPPHHEPENAPPFSCQLWGYAGLHYLRRIAAHVAAGRPMPEPGREGAADDPILLARYAGQPENKSLFRKFFGRANRSLGFEHLIDHSDAEGYYLPRDFTKVLVASPEWKIPGCSIGSAPRLLAECERLATLLELPLDLDPESKEMWAAPDSQGKGDIKWKRYGVESFTCLRLYVAAKHSVATGAALIFC